MKIFLQREIREAYAHAAAGGQALHVCESRGLVRDSAPGCFRRSEQFAHLFDQDYTRLIATAKRYGVKVVVPQHCGTHRQHVDLCGRPLKRAVRWAQKVADMERDAAKAKEAELAQVLMPLDLEGGK
jgi:hypothetical protein